MNNDDLKLLTFAINCLSEWKKHPGNLIMLFYLFFFHISHKFMDPNTFSLVMKRFACFITNVFVLSSTHRRCFMEKGVLKNFTKFTGKRLCRSAFFKCQVNVQSFWFLIYRIFFNPGALFGTRAYSRRTLGPETISDNWKPFKSDEKCFLFHVKSSFCSLDIYIFALPFWLCRKTAW